MKYQIVTFYIHITKTLYFTTATFIVMSRSHQKSNDKADVPTALTNLKLEMLDIDLYRTTHLRNISPSKVAYGGQIVAQSLNAARDTVGENFVVHSMHGYFLRPGSPGHPAIYRVSRTRDGKSFASRTVLALQKGVPILTLQASFHNEKDEVPCYLNYQPVFPQNVKHYSQLKTSVGIAGTGHDATIIVLTPQSEGSQTELPIEIKPLSPAVFLRKKASPNQEVMFWVRATSSIGEPSLISGNNINIRLSVMIILFAGNNKKSHCLPQLYVTQESLIS